MAVGILFVFRFGFRYPGYGPVQGCVSAMNGAIASAPLDRFRTISRYMLADIGHV
ncbi:hypothetical protein BIFDEN_02314 [Bifidobacterium dentium ATCC 27678]|nr:hypothetical protein BIFDEN_02314 [Bifidobacterium dentium ATCC 27678]BAQ26869.1 hypothetical protein BBDE_0875 [Bifidobacterium dentium JCM 1195 = DSM 20436]